MSTVATPATAPRLQVYNRSRFTPVAGDWDTLRTERIVSVMRGTVATLGLWTLSQDPLESALHVEIVRTLLYGYGALAAGLTVILFSVSSISPRLPPRCTVPAEAHASSFHGIGAESAQSILNTPTL